MAVDYAFFGLGVMGYGMASNIRAKIPSTSTLYIYDVYRPACDRLIAEFGKFGPIVVADSVKDATAKAKVVISSLPSINIVRDVYLNETTGVIAAPADPERLLLETSTNSSSLAREFAETLSASKSGIFVDVPVSGGGAGSLAGKLSFMIGHAKPDQSDSVGLRILDVLEKMGDHEKLFWCGKVGAGLAAKISNNYISCNLMLLIAEALAIGVRSGIDSKLLQEIIHSSSGQTFMGDIYKTMPRSKLFAAQGGFPVNLMIKDVGLGVDVAKETGVTPWIGEIALDLWKKAEGDYSIIPQDGFWDLD